MSNQGPEQNQERFEGVRRFVRDIRAKVARGIPTLQDVKGFFGNPEVQTFGGAAVLTVAGAPAGVGAFMLGLTFVVAAAEIRVAQVLYDRASRVISSLSRPVVPVADIEVSLDEVVVDIEEAPAPILNQAPTAQKSARNKSEVSEEPKAKATERPGR